MISKILILAFVIIYVNAHTCTYEIDINIENAGNNPQIYDLRIHYYDRNDTLIGKMTNRNILTTGVNTLKKIDSAIPCTGCVYDGKIRLIYNGDHVVHLPANDREITMRCRYGGNPTFDPDRSYYLGGNWKSIEGTTSCEYKEDEAYTYVGIYNGLSLMMLAGDRCEQVLNTGYCDYSIGYTVYSIPGYGFNLRTALEANHTEIASGITGFNSTTGYHTVNSDRIGCNHCNVASNIVMIEVHDEVVLDGTSNYHVICRYNNGSPEWMTGSFSTSWSPVATGFSCSAMGSYPTFDTSDFCRNN